MRRAFSLLEVLVASGLALLVLVFLGSAFVMSSRAWSQAQDLQNNQRSMLTLAYRLRHDYANCLPGSLHVSPTDLSFVSDDNCDWNVQGQPLWHRWVQYRFDPARRIVERREVPLVPPAAAAPAVPPSWAPNQPGVQLAECVTLFQVQSSGPASPLQVRLRSAQGRSSSRIDLDILPLLYGQD